MLDSQYKNIMEEVRGVRNEIANIDRDLAKDRQDIGDFKIQMANMKDEIKELRSMIGGNAARVKDSVTDALEPAVKSVDSLKQEIKKKKTMTIYDNKLISWIKNKLNGKQEIDKG